jgi:hypothetical protein
VHTKKEKNQRFKLGVLTFTEMLAEDANLLPDRLLSSLLSLSLIVTNILPTYKAVRS